FVHLYLFSFLFLRVFSVFLFPSSACLLLYFFLLCFNSLLILSYSSNVISPFTNRVSKIFIESAARYLQNLPLRHNKTIRVTKITKKSTLNILNPKTHNRTHLRATPPLHQVTINCLGTAHAH